MKTQGISEQNLKALELIREIMVEEDGKEVTVDQTLRRVLEHYKTHVPFN